MRKKIRKMDCIEYLSVQAPLDKVNMLEDKQSRYIHDFAKKSEYNIVGKIRRNGFSQRDVDRQWLQIANMIRKKQISGVVVANMAAVSSSLADAYLKVGVIVEADLINNQGLQINTLETINTVLRPTFQLAVRDDIIRKNPVDGAYCEVKKRNGGSRKSRRALTVDQQRKFMEYVAKNPFFYHWYPFFVFLLGTGCRIGEAIGIRWDDIDMENRIIDINHSLTYYQRADDSYKCEFRVSLPKTEAGNRRIPMMQQVYDVLQEEYDRQKQEGFCIENVDGMTNFVFTNRFGMPHNPAAVNRAIKRIVDTHNSEEEVAAKKEKREPIMIPRFSCHIFRHTFASRFCENETNIKVIQEVMGHADVSTTMNIYAEANPDVTKSVIEKLSKNMDIF